MWIDELRPFGASTKFVSESRTSFDDETSVYDTLASERANLIIELALL